jgi:hypothetical protein
MLKSKLYFLSTFIERKKAKYVDIAPPICELLALRKINSSKKRKKKNAGRIET